MIDSLFEMLCKIMLCFGEVCLLNFYISLPTASHCHLLQWSYLRHMPSNFSALVWLLCHCVSEMLLLVRYKPASFLFCSLSSHLTTRISFHIYNTEVFCCTSQVHLLHIATQILLLMNVALWAYNHLLHIGTMVMCIQRSACEIQKPTRLCFWLLYFHLVFDTLLQSSFTYRCLDIQVLTHIASPKSSSCYTVRLC